MPGAIKLRYIVVGTGRSGTVSVAKWLTRAGVACSHERFFRGTDADDLVRALTVPHTHAANSDCSTHFGLEPLEMPIAESSFMAVPFLEHPVLRDCAIIHVVRDPLKVIRSLLNNICYFRTDDPEQAHAGEQFIRRHLPHLDVLPDAATRACYYYLRWNQMIEEAAGARRYLRHAIENGPGPVLDFVGADPGLDVPDDPACNAYRHWPDHLRVECELPPVSDDEIQACPFWKEVATLAVHYGYSYHTRFDPSLRCADGPARTRRPEGRSAAGPVCYPAEPRLLQDDYYGYSIVQYRKEFIGVDRMLGPVDVRHLTTAAMTAAWADGRLLTAGSPDMLRNRILELRLEAASHTVPQPPEAIPPKPSPRGLPLVAGGHKILALAYRILRRAPARGEADATGAARL